jgi:hypothetical protein
VADYGGQRQIRQEASQPRLGPVDVLSADAHQFVDAVPAQRAEYAANPIYNGADALKRLRSPDGG